MYINKKNNLPSRQTSGNTNVSMYVFIYYTNNTRFCLGHYNFEINAWVDSDGMIITEDLLWCYLPVKQMKAYIRSMGDNGIMY